MVESCLKNSFKGVLIDVPREKACWDAWICDQVSELLVLLVGWVVLTPLRSFVLNFVSLKINFTFPLDSSSNT